MSEQQSIRDELADLIPLGFTERDPDSNVFEAADRILASPVIRRIQADAYAQGCSRAMRYMSDEPHLSIENPYRDKADV